MRKLIVVASAAALVCAAFAQEPGRGEGAPRAQGAGRGPAVVSPEVHPDRTVTMRVLAPNAKIVTLTGEIIGNSDPVPMTKGDNGVWSITRGPLPPDVYTYGFVIDGLTVIDQSGNYPKPSTPIISQVVVPGDGPQFYDARPVPHGDLRIVTYEAKTMGGQTHRMRVYTPPDYDSGNRKYPVVYLFHGGGSWDVSWTDVGRAHLIMDNLIAEGKAKPMIVVMPSIFQQEALSSGGVATTPRGAAPASRGATAGQDDSFTKELIADIMPFIQKRYRVLTGPDTTAIAGLSAGGAQTLRSGLAHVDLFHYIVALSPAVGMGGGPGAGESARPDPTAAYPALLADVAGANRKLKLFAIYNGNDDATVGDGPKVVADALAAKGIKVKYTESDGGHWFLVWRKNLRDFAPLLFR